MGFDEIETAMREDGETDYEYRIIAADQTIRWVHDRGRFYRDENNNIVFWQGIIIDITERKQAEKSFRKTRNDTAVFSKIPMTSFMFTISKVIICRSTKRRRKFSVTSAKKF